MKYILKFWDIVYWRAKKLESLTSHAGEDMGSREPSRITGGDVDWYGHFGRE